MSNTGKFLYFAYGSNLLAKRIHINNPSAVRAGIGKLDNYELDFMSFSKRWKGAAATIVARQGKHVWGALWEIDNIHLESLDRQEGVDIKMYFPKTVQVTCPNGTTKEARVYEQTKTPEDIKSIEDLPEERRPSAIYLKTILQGADESKLPDEYISWLKRIPDNGYSGSIEINIDN